MDKYSKWEKWANDYDDEGNNKKEVEEMMKSVKCEIGKPISQEEFEARNKNDSNVQTIKMPQNSN